jgi:negative regulator of flagellin synthesis FlgM
MNVENLMTDAINSNNRIKAPNQPAQQSSQKSAGKAPQAAPGAAVASAVVELSSERLLDQVGQLPEVDQSRVERIKTALANGEYQPDPQVIAQKFAEIEKLLP